MDRQSNCNDYIRAGAYFSGLACNDPVMHIDIQPYSHTGIGVYVGHLPAVEMTTPGARVAHPKIQSKLKGV